MISVVSRKWTVPTPLVLIVVAAVLSIIPGFPKFDLSPEVILKIILPLLVYQTAISGHWRDIKSNLRPILLLSIGHVLFITAFVAFVCHHVLGLSWELSVIIGAIVSPPDDVALVSVARNLPIPKRVVSVLAGEGLFNDATALAIFKFALIAQVAHEWNVGAGILRFVVTLFGEIGFGLLLGAMIGGIRKRIRNPEIEILLSLISPFAAYLPCEHFGGTGVLATATLGFYIGSIRTKHFSSEARILGFSVWTTIALVTESLLFMWAGLNAKSIVAAVSNLDSVLLLQSAAAVCLAIVVGRFIWVFPATYLPRWLFRAVRKYDPVLSWKYPFLIAWCGMRGAVSIAAAMILDDEMGLSAQDRAWVAYLTLTAVVVTLVVQGLSLPVILKYLSFDQITGAEKKHRADERKLALETLEAHLLERDPFAKLEKQRKQLLELYESGDISTDVFQEIERALDYREGSHRIAHSRA